MRHETRHLLPPMDDVESQIHIIDRKRVIVSLAYTAVFNTVIALFLTATGFADKGFFKIFAISQCIGLSICSCVLAAHVLMKTYSPVRHFGIILLGIAVGTVGGSILGAVLAGIEPAVFFRGVTGLFFQTVCIGILFGTLFTYFLFNRERVRKAKELLQEERIRRLTLEKREAETRLKLLQAQVEPHFLFNTLSTVLALMESDAKTAGAMLSDLTRYLRASLSRTRMEAGTLGEEAEMIRAYLGIHKARMGERLSFRIHIPGHLMTRPFPPMLIQPLVENALKHGLEPKVQGGEVALTAEETGGSLRLAVSDTGVGFQGDHKAGIGLDNVRQRLQSLYNGRARLTLEENRPCGLRAVIEVSNE
jgi:hypothetical protein